MKILYIHQYFNTPEESGGTRSYWICQELIKNGHSVTMLTSSNQIKIKFLRASIDEIDVVYLKVAYDNKMSLLKRFLSFFNFMIRSSLVALKEKNIDLVIATSTPLTVGFPPLILKLLKNIPFIFEVRDLWPEVPIQMGGIKNKLVIRLAYWFEKAIYKNAKHIIALSPGMKEGILNKKIHQEKVSMIPNMSKIDIFWSREKNIELNNRLGLKKDSFKVVYFGAMGLANGINYLIEGIGQLKYYTDIEFLFIGEGALEQSLKSQLQNNSISNIHFLGSFPLVELSEIVNLCDVSLVTFTNIPILATNSPNKLFDSLSAGKAIIVNSSGWTKELVEDNKCGFYVNAENPSDLANKILQLKNDSDLCLEMGRNSRKLAESTFDKSLLCKEYVDVVDSLKITS